MTDEEAEQAIRAAGVGWDHKTQGVVPVADETPGYRNAIFRASAATAATRAGATGDELGAAILALVNGDEAQWRAILAAP